MTIKRRVKGGRRRIRHNVLKVKYNLQRASQRSSLRFLPLGGVICLLRRGGLPRRVPLEPRLAAGPILSWLTDQSRESGGEIVSLTPRIGVFRMRGDDHLKNREILADFNAIPRRRNQTTPEVQPCRSSLGHPIIGVPALLKVADWCRLRREQSQHGGSPCDTPRPDRSPRAAEGPLADTSHADLESPHSIRSRSDAPDAQSRPRAATAELSRREGGRS